MYEISVTFAVFKYSRPEIVSNPLQFLKKSINDVRAYVLKLLSKTTLLIFPVSIPKREHILLTVSSLLAITILFKSRLPRLLEDNVLKVNVWFVASYSAT